MPKAAARRLAAVVTTCPVVRRESGRRGSNPRHQAWKACALPTELLPRSFRSCFRLVLSRGAPTPSPIDHSRHGGGRIRTFEGLRRQIYSLLPLATWVPHPAPRAAGASLRFPRPPELTARIELATA